MSAAPSTATYPLGDLEFCADPYPTWEQLRGSGPVVMWEGVGAHLVVGFDAVRQVLADTEHFSPSRSYAAEATPLATPGSQLRRIEDNGLFHIPPADHRRIRRLVNPAFTPRTVARLRPRIAELTSEVLAPLSAGDPADLAGPAQQLPVAIMGEYLGFDPDTTDWLLEHTASIFTFSNPFAAPELRARLEDDLATLDATLTVEFDRRRTSHAGDLLSDLVAASEDGDRLSNDELFALVVALLIAGAETTTNLLTLGTLALLEHPHTAAELRTDPTLVPAAMEEIMRWSYIGFGIARFAITDTELAGTPIPAGSLLLVSIGAALRDPSVVDNPDTFDIHRTPAPPLAFGVGVRHCLGEGLARATGEEFFTQLCAFDLEADGAPEFSSHPVLRGLSNLPVRVRHTV